MQAVHVSFVATLPGGVLEPRGDPGTR